jgi:glycosyltransferase involved in cell wall biosynthesis
MSREFYRLGWPLRSILAGLERRWAHAVDRVLTVNEHCADLLVGQLRIPRPVVVMNCREAWTPPDPRPDRIRSVLDLSPETLIVLYEGALMGERGIEQSMDAILDVPGAVLVLLGFGSWERRLRDHAAAPPYVGRVFVLPAVAPDDLLEWIASADVMVMPIQDTTINHRFSTPQKLFEAIAAGVPVVASDLPGMAEVVSESDVGVLCDPTSPAAIAAAIRTILEKPQDERGRMRARILHIAHERCDWETQLRTLLEVYGELAPVPVAPATSAEVRAPSVS